MVSRESLPNNPYDAICRILFEDPVRADPLIREYLPPEIREELTEDLLQQRPGSWFDPHLVGHQADILYEGRLKWGGPALIYILLEHKSYVDKKLPLQLLRYQSRIWEGYRKGDIPGGEGRSSEGLPPVVPMAFYHGKQRWNGPLSVADMLSEETPEVFRDITPTSECIIHDLGAYESEALSQDVVSWAVLSALVMSSQGMAPPERLGEVLAAIPPGHPLLSPLIHFITHTMDLQEEDLERIGRDARPQDWEGAMVTVAEQIMERGLEKGLAQGRVELLLRQLTRRFGSVSPSVRSRVLSGSEREVDAWADAVLEAESVEEIFAASSEH